jgi:hypothetical protein
MKNRCDDYSYFSLNALSYLTTLLIGIAFGLSISIMTFHISDNIYKSIFYLIYLAALLVVLGIVFRGITIYFWYKNKEWAVAKKLACYSLSVNWSVIIWARWHHCLYFVDIDYRCYSFASESQIDSACHAACKGWSLESSVDVSNALFYFASSSTPFWSIDCLARSQVRVQPRKS